LANEIVSVSEVGKVKQISVLEALFSMIRTKNAQGDIRAMRIYEKWCKPPEDRTKDARIVSLGFPDNGRSTMPEDEFNSEIWKLPNGRSARRRLSQETAQLIWERFKDGQK